MPETQREPVPRNDSSEMDTALAFLDFARNSVFKKVAGLDDEQVRRVLVGSGTSLLGLIQHLAVGERWWLGFHLAGEGSADDFDFSMVVDDDRSTDEVIADYRAAIAASDALIAAAEGMEALSVQPVDGRPKSLRWVLTHLTSETARHAGHADILRELIDGTTGR